MLTLGQITICNVSGVTCGDESSSNSAVPLSSAEHFSILQLIVLVLRPTALLF